MKSRGRWKGWLVVAIFFSIFLFTCHFQGDAHSLHANYTIDISSVSGQFEHSCIQISEAHKSLRALWGKMSSNTGYYDPGSITVLTYDLASRTSVVSHPTTVDRYSHEWLTFAPKLHSRDSPGLERDPLTLPFPTWGLAGDGGGGLGLRPIVCKGHSGIVLTRFNDGNGRSRALAWHIEMGDDDDRLRLAQGLWVDESGRFAVLYSPESSRIYLYELGKGVKESPAGQSTSQRVHKDS